MGRKKHITLLREFKEELKKQVKIDYIILFGSRAWGKPHKDSDFDLIIVSPDFRKKKFLKRGVGMYDHWHLNYPVDFLCYTPEEFKKLSKQVTIVREAVEKGIEI